MSIATPKLSLPWGPHLKTLAKVQDISDVDSHEAHQVAVRVQLANLDNAILGVFGTSGIGKTFAVARAAELCAADPSHPTRVVHAELAGSTTGRGLLRDLYEPICGGPAPRGFNADELRDEIRAELVGQHTLIVIDEVQYVQKPALRSIRKLWGQSQVDICVVLIGTPNAYERLELEMRTRMSTVVRMVGLRDDEVVDALCAYHPIFTTADPGRLVALNKTRAWGRFRWWAHFLHKADLYTGPMDAQILTDELCMGIADEMPSAR
jgi:AAA domain-containing protein